jgi:hypothetical protein
MKDIDAITADVLDVALRLHRALGPGLLESVYEMLRSRRLQALKYRVATQQRTGAEFDGIRFEAAFHQFRQRDAEGRLQADSQRLPPLRAVLFSPRLRVNDPSFGA